VLHMSSETQNEQSGENHAARSHAATVREGAARGATAGGCSTRGSPQMRSTAGVETAARIG